jgi:hypothetical protein
LGTVLELSGHLSSKQREVLLLLARGNSPSVAASKANVAVQTIYNWKSCNPEFRLELERLQNRLYQEGVGSLRSLVHQAAATLREIMSRDAARDSDRIAAARTVLQFAMSAQDGGDPDVGEDDREFRDVVEELAKLVRTGHAS